MNCQILCGHSNIVLSLGSSPVNQNLLISSDKVIYLEYFTL